MREFNEDAQTPEIGFLIGYDFYRYGWSIERSDELQQLNAAMLKPVIDGYNEARHTQTSQNKHPDYFQKKLMQIRARAYRKGVKVSITETDIEHAFHVTEKRCPATTKPLTMGTGKDTDLSIDRVDNDKGYEPENIFVMSSYANKAKDDISLEELMMYASCMDDDMTDHESYSKFSAMSQDEWVRLYIWIAEFMTDELVDKTAYRVVQEHQQITFVLEAFYLYLFIVFAQQPKKAFQRELLEWKIIKSYTGLDVLNERQRTRLRKAAVKHASRHYQIMENSQGMMDTIESFIQLESIQDIKDVLDKQILADMLAEDGTKRVRLIKELYHRKYLEGLATTDA